MMDTKISTPISNEDTKYIDLLCDITGVQNNKESSEPNNCINTPVVEIEAPLSPVLSNSRKSLKHIARRKSRIKLSNRFSQCSFSSQDSLQSESHTETTDTEICNSGLTNLENNENLEERMKKCIEMQKNKKFCYDIAKTSSYMPLKQIEFIDDKIVELPLKSYISKTSVENKENDFNFKKPESPVSASKLKNKIEQKLELNLNESNFNLNVGFETGSGKKINLSERALKRAAKLFDDIDCDLSNILNSESVFKTNEATKTNEQPFSAFKTASGNILKLSETSLQKSKKIFDDIDCNLSNILNSESVTKTNEATKTNEQTFSTFKTASGNILKLSETSLQKSKQIFDDIYELSNENEEINNLDQEEKNDSLENKREFKMPVLPTDKNETSPTKTLFSQITDSQICWAAENAECVVNFDNTQWSPSPKSKKTQLSVEINREIDFLSPEGENLFGNLTVCEDGSIRNRLQHEDEENLSDSEVVHLTISEQTLKNAEKIFQDEYNNKNFEMFRTKIENKTVEFSKQNEREIDENLLHTEYFEQSYENNNKQSLTKCGFSTASGNVIKISDESLNKVKNIFTDCSFVENDQNSEIILSEPNLEMSLLASVSVQSEFLEENAENSFDNQNLTEIKSDFTQELNEFNISNSEEEFETCGFVFEDALKSLKILELYKRSFKYIEKDIKNNFFYPISFTFGDILTSKDYKNKNYKYSLRNRKRSGVIYTNKEKKSRKSSNNSQSSSEILNTSMTTRSKRKSTNEELFLGDIISDTQTTRSRKRKSKDISQNSDMKMEKTVTNVNKNIKKTIENLENEFLNSIENSVISPEMFLSCESNENNENNMEKCIENKNTNSNIHFELTPNSEENMKKGRNIVQDITDCNSTVQNNFNDSEKTKLNFELNKFSGIDLSTVSGKNVTISEDALQKAQNIFQDCENTETFSEQNTKISENNSFGFVTASGKNVQISETALKKAKSIFQDCDIEENLNKNISTFGFPTAAVKNVQISEESLKKAKNIFQDSEDILDINLKNSVDSKKISSCGFASASGKTVPISEEALKKARNMFQDCSEDNLDNNLKNSVDSKKISSCGFASASGKTVSVSEEALKKARNMFQDCSEDNLDNNLKNSVDSNKISSCGFASASGKTVSISEEGLKKARNMFQDCSEDNLDINLKNSVDPKKISSCGFASASGKTVSISEEALRKARNMFQDCSEDNLDINLKNSVDSKKISSCGFASASGKTVPISEEALKKARNMFQDCSEDNLDNNLKNSVDSKKISSCGFASASGKTVSISEEALKKARNMFQDCSQDNLDNNLKNSVDSKKISSCGFASASGKTVSISEEGLKKARNMFQDCSEDNLDINLKNSVDPKKISSCGFASASGKTVSISEEALRKARNMFQDCSEDNLDINLKNSVDPKKISSCGFASASGKTVSISEEALKKARNMFQDCSEDNLDINLKNSVDSKKISSCGFALASGKAVSISEESLKKPRNMFQDCSEDNLDINLKNSVDSKKISSFGFASASGKTVSISEEALKKARNMFQDCSEDNLDINLKNSVDSKKISSCRFASASGKTVSISEEALKKARNIFQNCSEDNLDINLKKSVDSKKISSCGFASASGKTVSISEEALKKAKNIFQDCEDNFITNVDKTKNISSASGNKILVSEDAFKKVKNIFEDLSNEDTKSTSQVSVESGKNVNISEDSMDSVSKDEDNNIEILNMKKKFTECNTPNNNVLKVQKSANKSYSSPQTLNNTTPVLRKNLSARNSKKRSLGVSSCKQINIEENTLKRAKLVFDDLDTPKKKEPNINNNQLLNYSVLNTPSVSKSSPNISSQILKQTQSKSDSISPRSLLNSSVSMKETNQMIKLNLSQTKISPVKVSFEENQNNSAFQFRENTTGDVKKWTTDLQKDLEMLKLKMSVIETRIMMMNKQQEIIDSGSSDHRRQRPGHLFTQKLNHRSRISLKEAVNNRRPQKNTHQICQTLGLDISLLNITPENSTKLHFHAPWWINDNRTYPAVIRTEDGAVIIPNQQNFIGVSEIERAFLAMPGVDPTLVVKKWVWNHYRWIVWKMASMERNYPDVFKDYLCVENVIAQLKYRYDREIDRAQRSAIKKIVECDDTATKRMVLCVANILKTENQHELELTDGWYSIKTIIDTPLNSLVEKRLIKPGIKLITQGAELLNCEGCCPLELPSNVRLQIHFNSTRRAAWHVKLGFCPYPGPLLISLRMISGSGGPIGGTIAYIARVYPISYMERGELSAIWRNERAEIRRANQWEAEYANTMENVQAKVEEELEKEWRERDKKKERLKMKDVKGVQCGKTLYQFLEESNDPDSVKEMLTSAQISSLQEYQIKLNLDHQTELSSRLREKLSKENIKPRDVCTVFKLLLVDVQTPYHSRSMSIWRPTESHSQMLKEGIVINIFNATAKINGTLSTNQRTQFEENCDYDSKRYSFLNRVVTPISQTCNPDFKLKFGEFDTVGMVVSVDVQQTKQTLWMVDENQRFLCVVIRDGPNTCILLDGITPGKIVSVVNLIYKKPINSYGESIGNYYSVLSSYPQQTYLQEYMKEFIENLPQDIDQYLEECQNKVQSFSSNNSKSNISLFPFMNNSNEEKELFCKKLLGLDNSQQNKQDSPTLSDEEMALLDTQIM